MSVKNIKLEKNAVQIFSSFVEADDADKRFWHDQTARQRLEALELCVKVRMGMKIQIPKDFREFLKLLKENEVEYLLIGGYAVGYYGYPRPTGDMDIWISRSYQNAKKIVSVLNQFGFTASELSVELFTQEKSCSERADISIS
ncbi:MAG: hypothetical protein LC768_03320 [Acidobacteria bacterium]|nr:hypothetical protein [Acidobacteriota bacterium]